MQCFICVLIYIFFFFFPGELDYSVHLTSDRNQLIKQLSAYQRIDTRKSTVELQQKLYGILVNKHPIQERLQTLSSKEVKKLHTEFLFKTSSSELTCRKIDRDISIVWSLI